MPSEEAATARGDLAIPAQAYHETLMTRSYEVGRDGKARPGVILRYLEHLATRASAALGFGNRWYRDHNGAWVVREMSLLIGELPGIDNELRLATWVSDFRRVQAMREYLITDAASGRLVARAAGRWAYIDRTRLLPTRIPDEITTRMGPWGYAMRPRPPAPRAVEAPTAAEMRLTARGYEADTQRHVNNCVYLDWFDEAAERAAVGALMGANEHLRPRFYRLEYIQQTQPGDALRVLTVAPQRTGSRGLGFWQTLIAADGAVVARVWAEGLRARDA
jgi:acyl-ACP thioesterase